jgi:hypothetical protein
MSSGFSMLASTLKCPPQRAHCSISIPNTRRDRRTQRSVRCEHAMKSRQTHRGGGTSAASLTKKQLAEWEKTGRSSGAGLIRGAGHTRFVDRHEENNPARRQPHRAFH